MLSCSAIMSQVSTSSSLYGRGNATFVVDCNGKFPICAEEIVKFVGDQKVKEVNRRSYYTGQKNEYFYFQFKCSDTNYDTLYSYLTARNINASNLTSSYRSSNYRKVDTMVTYRNMIIAEQDMNKWAEALESIKVTDPIYMTYYNKYKQSERTYTSQKRNLKNQREQMEFPYTFTVTVYKDKNKVAVNNRNAKFKYEYKFTPSLSLGVLAPSVNTGGNYLGVLPEITLYSQLKSYSRRSPSYAKVYAHLGVFVNESNSQERRYLYAAGANASFENRIDRNWFIPYFGFELGAVNERILGGSFFVQPKLGFLFYANKNIHVFGEGGYFYATQNSTNFESVAASFGVNMMLWQD